MQYNDEKLEIFGVASHEACMVDLIWTSVFGWL